MTVVELAMDIAMDVVVCDRIGTVSKVAILIKRL